MKKKRRRQGEEEKKEKKKTTRRRRQQEEVEKEKEGKMKLPCPFPPLVSILKRWDASWKSRYMPNMNLPFKLSCPPLLMSIAETVATIFEIRVTIGETKSRT